MDSSNSALYIRSYPENKYSEKLAKIKDEEEYIADLRAQGKDIIRTWLHYSMLKSELLFSKPMFNNIWISGHVMDKNGMKMSKSKGNITKPEPMIEKYGADALRLFGASEASLGSDIRFNEDKLAGLAKFLTKLFNIAKFINNFDLIDQIPAKRLYDTDKWLLYELIECLTISYNGYDQFDFYIPANALFSFTWDTLSNHYIEMIKSRLFSGSDIIGKQSCIWTLNFTLNALLKAFSPIIPFLTDYLYRNIFGKEIYQQTFEDISKLSFNFTKETSDLIKEFNAKIWKIKQEKKISLKEAIEIDEFPSELERFKSDLIPMHQLKIKYKP